MTNPIEITNEPVLGYETEDGRRIVGVYRYASEEAELYRRVLVKEPDGGVTAQFFYPLGDGRFVFGRDEVRLLDDGTVEATGMRRPHILYNAHRFQEVDMILIVETESEADALGRLGFVGTTSPIGIEHFRGSFVRSLAAKDCVLVPRNNQQSQQRFERLAKKLAAAEITVHTLHLPFTREDQSLADVMRRRGDLAVFAAWINAECERLEPWKMKLDNFVPVILPAKRFRALPQRAQEYLIPGVLPVGGKLTFSGPAKLGKSWFAMQVGLALASGYCNFLGWEFQESRRVLYLQVEIRDNLVRQRLDSLFETMPGEIDPERASMNFFIHPIRDRVPELSSDEGRQILQAQVELYEPDVLIIDPLFFAFPGLIENASESMGAALRFLTEFSAENEVAIILLHHHGKTGAGSRGSSVYEGWGDSDMQASFVKEREGVCKVDLRLRCAFKDGPLYWRLPARDDPWFVLDREGGTAMRAAEPPKRRRIATVADLCRQAEGGLRPTDLQTQICEATGVGTTTAKEAISTAVEAGLIAKVGGRYTVTPKLQGAHGVSGNGESSGNDYRATDEMDNSETDSELVEVAGGEE